MLMRKLALSTMVLLFSCMSFANKFVVLDGPQLCSWYQDSNSCVNRTIELISSYSSVGRIGIDNKSCDLADGSQFLFKTSMDGMLNTSSAKVDWNFDLKNSSGTAMYDVTKSSTSDSSFSIHGVNKAGRWLDATFNSIRSEDSNIVYVANCDNYDSKGHIEYIVTWDAFWEAKKICPQLMGSNSYPSFSLSSVYRQVGSRIEVEPYVEFEFNQKKIPFFTCRNY